MKRARATPSSADVTPTKRNKTELALRKLVASSSPRLEDRVLLSFESLDEFATPDMLMELDTGIVDVALFALGTVGADSDDDETTVDPHVRNVDVLPSTSYTDAIQAAINGGRAFTDLISSWAEKAGANTFRDGKGFGMTFSREDRRCGVWSIKERVHVYMRKDVPALVLVARQRQEAESIIKAFDHEVDFFTCLDLPQFKATRQWFGDDFVTFLVTTTSATCVVEKEEEEGRAPVNVNGWLCHIGAAVAGNFKLPAEVGVLMRATTLTMPAPPMYLSFKTCALNDGHNVIPGGLWNVVDFVWEAHDGVEEWRIVKLPPPRVIAFEPADWDAEMRERQNAATAAEWKRRSLVYESVTRYFATPFGRAHIQAVCGGPRHAAWMCRRLSRKVCATQCIQ